MRVGVFPECEEILVSSFDFRGIIGASIGAAKTQMSELERRLPMTCFGVMKHLRVLEGAGLVVTRRRGREKLHFLTPVPIRLSGRSA